ncbi:restriction endonuclease [Streptomyces sp. NPDC001941]|uniref:restriction endonuclease n=1 Tax=Streptomyces sp. NPDC001941 TaxID=3154659 RepID=UPI00332B5BDD
MRQRTGRSEWESAHAAKPRLVKSAEELDALDHAGFEYAIRDLMRRDGFRAKRVGGAGDDVCDVWAVDLDGRVWTVQAKHRRDGKHGAAIGVDVLQRLKGTASPVHRATFALVVTNGRFTKSAVPWGHKHGIHLVDRDLLIAWAAASRPLWELLDRVPPPLRHPADWQRGKA